MSTENESLFEGIQIMTPAELNAAVQTSTGTENPEDKTENDDFTIEPVISQTNAEEPIDKTIDTTANKTTDSSENSSDLKYKALMKELVNAGVLTVEQVEELEEMPGTFDSIKALMEKTVDGKLKDKEENWKKSMTGAKKRFLEIEDAFDDTDAAIQMAQRLEYLNSLSDETIKADVNLQKQLYYNDLISKGFSNEDAMEAIADAEAINKLEEKSLKSLPNLKEATNSIVEKSRLAKEEKTKQQIADEEAKFKSLIDNIDSRDSFIDGLQLNKVSKDKIKSNIMNVVHKDSQGREYNSLMYKQLRNPVEFEMLINYYDSIGMFNLDKEGKFKPDISKIKNVAKTQAVNELDKVIATEDQRGVGRNTSVEMSEKGKGIINLLEKAGFNK